MFLRSHVRFKDGKKHRYFTVVESVRTSASRSPYQRTLLYLGEINAEQEAQWIQSMSAFQVQPSAKQERLDLFPEATRLPKVSLPTVQLQLDKYTLTHPRQYGACWLANELWRTLQLDVFWNEKLGTSREGTHWASLLQISVAYRLIQPGSEWLLHRQWYNQSAMRDVLEGTFHWGCKDQLYQVLDKLLLHRKALFDHLKSRWTTLFGLKHEVLLYDLSSTYFEGSAEEIPKAKYGYSRDHRPDCKQVVLALVVTPEGFPLAYETLDGNTQDKETLIGFIERIEAQYGKAERVWIMDRGIPSEESLQELREKHPEVKYLVGTPKARVKETRPLWERLEWTKVRDSVEVKQFTQSEELYVVAKSGGRKEKEIAIRRKKLAQYLRSLKGMRKEKSRDRLLMRVGAAKSKAGRAKSMVQLTLPKAEEPPSPETFKFKLLKEKLKEAELYDGHYLLRTNLSGKEPKGLWELYLLLVEIEGVFRNFKNDLGIRPIYHQLGDRVDAHIFVCFMAYCQYVTLKHWLKPLASGLTPREALAHYAKVQMIDVEFPTTDGRTLVMRRHTQADDGLKLLMARMNKHFPEQPPPKLKSGTELEM